MQNHQGTMDLEDRPKKKNDQMSARLLTHLHANAAARGKT